jgi:hypothetical protein
MTQVELEQIAREVRARGLHSSWNELLEFSESVVGSLVDAYQALLRNSVSSGNMLSANASDLRVLLQEKLGKALVSLASREQVAKWGSEASASDIPDIPEKPGGI